MDYQREDRIALERALLSMYLCPRCRMDLSPVAYTEDTWGCRGDSSGLFNHPPETWHIPARIEGA